MWVRRNVRIVRELNHQRYLLSKFEFIIQLRDIFEVFKPVRAKRFTKERIRSARLDR